MARQARAGRPAGRLIATGIAPPPPSDDLPRFYLRLLAPLLEAIEASISPLVKAFAKAQSRVDSIRHDVAVPRSVRQAQAAARRRYEPRQRRQARIRIAEQVATQVDAFNATGQARALAGPGARFVSQTSIAAQAEIDGWARSNVDLISTVPDRFTEEVGDLINEAWRAGWAPERLATALGERFEVAESNATRIAVNEIQTLNGQLAEVRQTEAGIRSYTWGPTSSVNPREFHKAFEGRIFQWNDPPPGGHPGALINCKHIAIPVI